MTSDINPWTEQQFKTELRKAGYKSMGQGCYRHNQTKYIFCCWTWVQTTMIGESEVQVNGEQWRAWAAAHKTPPPF